MGEFRRSSHTFLAYQKNKGADQPAPKSFPADSEVELQSKLNQAWAAIVSGRGRRRTVGCHLSEQVAKARCTLRGTRAEELDMVKGVEESSLELQRLTLGDFEVLQDRNVKVVESWPAQKIASAIAVTEKRYSTGYAVR